MNFIISVINTNGLSIMHNICERLEVPIVLTTHGKGTATQTALDVLGIESNEKRIVVALADQEKTNALILEQKRRLYIDAPGNGIVISVPVKSVGGVNTFNLINGEKKKMKNPSFDFEHELIVIIANEGYTDAVMDLARGAGAGGGTVIHAKGTGGRGQEKFFNVSIAEEKEVIIIVAKKSNKADIMKAVIEKAGTGTEIGAIAFSLPVSNVEGFRRENQE